MGVSSGLFKTGLVLVVVGFVVSLAVPTLGFLLGRLGLVLIGGAVLLPVLGYGVLLFLGLAAAAGVEQSDETTDEHPLQRAARQRDAGREARDNAGRDTASTQRSGGRTETGQLDRDVESIDEYRR